MTGKLPLALHVQFGRKFVMLYLPAGRPVGLQYKYYVLLVHNKVYNTFYFPTYCHASTVNLLAEFYGYRYCKYKYYTLF